MTKAAQAAAIVFAVGGIAALLAGVRLRNWARPAGVALLMFAVLSQAVAIQAGPGDGRSTSSVSPGITFGPPVTGTPSTEPPSSNVPVQIPTSIHPHLLDAIHYGAGTTIASLRSLNREWVELTNISTKPVTITGWRLVSSSGAIYYFPSFVLAPDTTVKVHTGPGTNSSTSLYWGRTSFAWNDTQGEAILRNASGVTQDTCRYNDGAVSSQNC
jgi:lamin tail-like protein